MPTYTSLGDALEDLKQRGYDLNFEPDETCLYCSQLDMRLLEEEFRVDEYYRFEGTDSNNGKGLLLALSSSNGVKGFIIDGIGEEARHLDIEWIRKLQVQSVYQSSEY